MQSGLHKPETKYKGLTVHIYLVLLISLYSTGYNDKPPFWMALFFYIINLFQLLITTLCSTGLLPSSLSMSD